MEETQKWKIFYETTENGEPAGSEPARQRYVASLKINLANN